MKKTMNFIDEMIDGLLAKDLEKHTPTKGVTIKPSLKMYMSLFGALLFVYSTLAQQASGSERIRVIVDTDIECEMDDQHALAYTLFNSHVFDVEGVTITGEHSWQAKTYEKPYDQVSCKS